MSTSVRVYALLALLARFFVLSLSSMPLPWTRVLSSGMTGNDVYILQNLLLRDQAVAALPNPLVVSSTYDAATQQAVQAFQEAHGLTVSPDASFGEESANAILSLHSQDGVRDSGFTAASLGYLYKIHVPVHQNRSIETTATLYDANNVVLLEFTVRAHGHRDNDDGTLPWPDFGDGDVGLNTFSSNGMTTTGIIEIDLNTAEPNATLYGPWPVNRLVRGLQGNAQFLLPYIRDGQLLHTGNWTTASTGEWNPTLPMPNSSGCLHAHPSAVEKIASLLTSVCGVTVNENPFSGKNYPFKPQGIMVVEAIAA